MRQTTIIVVAAATKQVVVHQRLQRVQRLQRPLDLQPLSEIPENQSVIVGHLAIAGPLMPLMNADAADQRAWSPCAKPPSSLSPRQRSCCSSAASACSAASAASRSPTPLRNSGEPIGNCWEFGDCWAADAADER